MLYKPIVGDHGVFLGAMPSLFVTSPQRCAVVYSLFIELWRFCFVNLRLFRYQFSQFNSVQFGRRNRKPFAVRNSNLQILRTCSECTHAHTLTQTPNRRTYLNRRTQKLKTIPHTHTHSATNAQFARFCIVVVYTFPKSPFLCGAHSLAFACSVRTAEPNETKKRKKAKNFYFTACDTRTQTHASEQVFSWTKNKMANCNLFN